MLSRQGATSVRSCRGKDKAAQIQRASDLLKVTWLTHGKNKMEILAHLLQEPEFPFLHRAVDLLVCSAGLTRLQDRSGLWGVLPDRSMSVCLQGCGHQTV